MGQNIFQTNAELKDWLSEQNSSIFFIPTMGGLHPGHQYLIQKAREHKTKQNQIILVSIFVNPLQFGKDEDFKKYPRNISKDAELAFNAGADAIWAPDYFEVFPGEKIHILKFKFRKHCTINYAVLREQVILME